MPLRYCQIAIFQGFGRSPNRAPIRAPDRPHRSRVAQTDGVKCDCRAKGAARLVPTGRISGRSGAVTLLAWREEMSFARLVIGNRMLKAAQAPQPKVPRDPSPRATAQGLRSDCEQSCLLPVPACDCCASVRVIGHSTASPDVKRLLRILFPDCRAAMRTDRSARQNHGTRFGLRGFEPFRFCASKRPGRDFDHRRARPRSRRTAPDRRRSSRLECRVAPVRRAARRAVPDRDARRPRRAAGSARAPVISAINRACASTSPISSAFCSPVEASAAAMLFRRIDDFEIGQMRAVERAPRGGVAGAVVAQHGAIAFLDLDRPDAPG